MCKVSDFTVYSQRRHAARKIAALFVGGLSLAITSLPARATEPVKIPMTAGGWTTGLRHRELCVAHGKAVY